ncbi:energy transducer TonB [Ideonella paludis]|nr:energy transducer TonB [Ideonella paludis]
MSLIAALRRALRRRATHLAQGCAQVLLIAGGASALAQTPPSPAASAPIADHVKRAAERPYYWIKLNAQAPEQPAARPKSAARPATKAAPATAEAATSAPTLPTRVSGITERVTPIFDSPALATSDPPPNAAAERLIATLESAPPAAGLPAPPAAEPAALSAPSTPTAPGATTASPAATSSANSRQADRATGSAASSATLRLLNQVEPDFPSALQRRLRQGSVEVAFTVLPDGSVSAPSVLRSSHPRLETPALEAVAQWRFAPIDAAKPGVVVLGFDLD